MSLLRRQLIPFHPKVCLRAAKSGGGDPDSPPTAVQSINIEGSHTAGGDLELELELHGSPDPSLVCWPFCLLFLFGFFFLLLTAKYNVGRLSREGGKAVRGAIICQGKRGWAEIGYGPSRKLP